MKYLNIKGITKNSGNTGFMIFCLFFLCSIIMAGCKLSDLSDPVKFIPTDKEFASFYITKGDLTHWDENSGPDIEMTLFTDEEQYLIAYQEDADSFDLLKWDLDTSIHIPVSNTTWRMLVTDIDKDGDHDTMIDMTFNPFQKLEPLATDDKKINLYYEDWKIEVTVRPYKP